MQGVTQRCLIVVKCWLNKKDRPCLEAVLKILIYPKTVLSSHRINNCAATINETVNPYFYVLN